MSAAAATSRRARRVGHKGADLIVPGNTAESFDAALAAGVDMIEFDVLSEHPDGSGELLLAHDYVAARAAHPRPPTLEEGLAHLAGSAFDGIELDVDLKLGGYEDRVVALLRERGLAERSLVSTQHPESLARVRELAPELRLGWSVPRLRNDPFRSRLTILPAYGALLAYRRALPGRARRALRAGRCDALMAHVRLVSPALVRAVHREGGELYVWTVDDPAQIARLEAMGADGVITNDPRLFSG